MAELARRREDEDNAEHAGKLIYLTRRIDYGHILQAVTGFILMTAFGVGTYIFVLGRISDHDGQILLLRQMVQADKEYIQRVDEAQRGLSIEIRGKIDRIIEMIGDIRERQGGGSRSDAPRH